MVFTTFWVSAAWYVVTSVYWGKVSLYVVVNFLFQVIFVFLLILGMIMYANEVQTKENKNYLR